MFIYEWEEIIRRDILLIEPKCGFRAITVTRENANAIRKWADYLIARRDDSYEEGKYEDIPFELYPEDEISFNMAGYDRPVSIGETVWICCNSETVEFHVADKEKLFKLFKLIEVRK